MGVKNMKGYLNEAERRKCEARAEWDAAKAKADRAGESVLWAVRSKGTASVRSKNGFIREICAEYIAASKADDAAFDVWKQARAEFEATPEAVALQAHRDCLRAARESEAA
jgi:hypothetical protein